MSLIGLLMLTARLVTMTTIVIESMEVSRMLCQNYTDTQTHRHDRINATHNAFSAVIKTIRIKTANNCALQVHRHFTQLSLHNSVYSRRKTAVREL